MNKIIEAILLGIIQGITEFLPISSSAHLKVFPWLFNWTEISPSFDVALHIGTLIALCIFFFKDGLKLVKSGLGLLFISVFKNPKYKMEEDKKREGKIFWDVVFVTLIAGILSLLLDKVSEYLAGLSNSAELICISISSIVMGTLLYIVDKKCSVKKDYDTLSLKDTFIVGLSQAFAAAFPGVSRSGITITTSRILGYDRKSSAKLSFILSIPIIAAAALVKVKDFDLTYPAPFFVGIFVSFIVGLFVISKLMKYMEKGNYKIFAIYRIVFGILLIISIIIKTKI